MANIIKNTENKKILTPKLKLKDSDTILLVSSKEDADLINGTNIQLFAIPINNKNSSQLKQQLNRLKIDLERVFVLGSDINHKERSKSFNTAKELGLTWIDTLAAKKYLKIPTTTSLLSWYARPSKDEPSNRNQELRTFLSLCIGSNSKVISYSDDSSSISISHCYKVHFQQYVGQTTPNQFGVIPVNFMHFLIAQKERVMLQSNAGTGKTTLMQLLVHQQQGEINKKTLQTPNLKTLRENLGIERVIIAVPTTAIGSQLGKSFNKKGLNVSVLDNKSNSTDVQAADYTNVIICCYDSIKKIPHLVDKKTLIVVDEFHQLVIDIEYRNKEAFRFLIDQLEHAKRVLLLSATPNYFFALGKDLNPFFGYTLVKGVPTVQNSIEIVPKVYECKRMDLLGYLIDHSPKIEGTTLCKFDSISNLQTACKVLETMKESCDYLCSKIPSQKEQNSTYNSIMNTSSMSSYIAFLFYTTLMEAGVSIEDKIRLNALIDTFGWQKAIQLISRPRYNYLTGTNKNQTVWLFRSKKYVEKNQDVMYKQPVIKRFNHLLEVANALCKHMNNSTYGDFKHKADLDPKRHKLITYYDREKQTYKPCILYILRIMHEQALKVPFDLTLKRIQRFDNRVIIKETEQINPDPNPIFEEIREEQKIKKEETLLELDKLFLSDFSTLVAAICHKNKDSAYTAKILSLFDGVSSIQKIEVRTFCQLHEEELRQDQAKKMLDKIYFLYDQRKDLKLSEITSLIVKSEPKDIDEIISQLGRKNRAFDYKYNNNLNPQDRVTYEYEKAISTKINKTFQNDIAATNKSGIEKGWRTAQKYQDIINSVIKKLRSSKKQMHKLVTKERAMSIINQLYTLKRCQTTIKKKRAWIYKLEQKKTIQESEQKMLELIEEYKN